MVLNKLENQLHIFLIFILSGFLIGLVFDFFRILRKSFKTKDLITYLEDFLFWIISGLILLFCIFKFNNGELRLYIFIGISIGFALYILLFSKPFIKINLYIINILKKTLHYTIVVPINFAIYILRKIIFKPISFTFINIKKAMSNIIKKSKKILLKKEKLKSKKDLA